ncbi:hypothetical protein BHU72_14805 [Desulfuribacillus stibiiarsenatis]|uniref:Uncharacterized protein n=1 Tax=Desulfuribacillus stibiiarsenatis TaxID=1390249 RepID=A0A1E5L792_9FIRM|nr:hypothetical protein [Desulfuribacillus stibiiarsenatis]OEH86020.1 hypothetical protein BHU72_14805 [Desulfuribacillus stibiiarsenatis]
MTENRLRQKQFLIITEEGKFVTALYDDLVKFHKKNVRFTFLKQRDIPICPKCKEVNSFLVNWDTGQEKCLTCDHQN